MDRCVAEGTTNLRVTHNCVVMMYAFLLEQMLKQSFSEQTQGKLYQARIQIVAWPKTEVWGIE